MGRSSLGRSDGILNGLLERFAVEHFARTAKKTSLPEAHSSVRLGVVANGHVLVKLLSHAVIVITARFSIECVGWREKKGAIALEN